VPQQRSPHRRPLWLLGFGIYITSNIFSTIFQLDALPIVILAPLGAVSLIYNALLARLLLGDYFGSRTAVGTLMVALGAVGIAVFGVVQEEEHTLEEILRLWKRPAFVAFFSVVTAAVVVVLLGVSGLGASWSCPGAPLRGFLRGMVSRCPLDLGLSEPFNKSSLAQTWKPIRLFISGDRPLHPADTDARSRPTSHHGISRGNSDPSRYPPHHRAISPLPLPPQYQTTPRPVLPLPSPSAQVVCGGGPRPPRPSVTPPSPSHQQPVSK
jgi:hypothetical protein